MEFVKRTRVTLRKAELGFLGNAIIYRINFKHGLISFIELVKMRRLNTSLKGLDFSQNTFERLTFSPNYLSGLKVTPEQAIYLASALGLVIT